MKIDVRTVYHCESSPTTILIMKKKSDKQVIRPDTCAKCNNGTIVPTAKGNPRVAYCFILKRRFVADSKRNCIHAY